MNLTLILVVGACAAIGWALVTAIRTGEFRYDNGKTGPDRSFTLLRRADHPTVFWLFAAAHVAVAIYVASYAFIP